MSGLTASQPLSKEFVHNASNERTSDGMHNQFRKYLRFHEIMERKGVSLSDISLSTSLPISIVNEIIEKGKGHLRDINKVMGCLNVSIEECIDEKLFKNNQYSKEGIINLQELFQKKSLIDLIQPEKVDLVRSFHQQQEDRYYIKVHPQSEEKNKTVSTLSLEQFIVTRGHKTEEAAKKEYVHLLKTKYINLIDFFPKVENVKVNKTVYHSLELLLDHYRILFDPSNSSYIYHIGAVYPIGTLINYNKEYLKKVYAICAKPKTHMIRSSIYSQYDYEIGKVDEHINLISMYEVAFKDKMIIEFLVPQQFDEEKHFIETTSIYTDLEKLSFHIKKK